MDKMILGAAIAVDLFGWEEHKLGKLSLYS